MDANLFIEVFNFLFLGITVFMGVLAIDSTIREKEYRALLISTCMFIPLLGAVVFLILKGGEYTFLNGAFGVSSLILAALFITPFSTGKKEEKEAINIELFDERDHMFSRNALKDSPENYEEYYKMRPENLKGDKAIHAKEDLDHPSQLYFEKYFTPVFEAAFTYLDRVRFVSDGAVKKEKVETDPRILSSIIKDVGLLYGAVDIGITKLEPWHFYSHRGRRAEGWGDKIKRNHKFGIAIVVKMDPPLLKKAPTLSAIVESSHQYVEAGKVANVIAHYLRALGYNANANVDGHYETLCVPVAVDAGVGVLSRMGLLMHPVYGPCVRISVVTTDADLLESEPVDLSYMRDFCVICKKCATNCPTKSIPSGDDEPESRGIKHWHIDQEKCFSLWKSVGTDCGFCIGVCPYTKPDTLFHRMVRFFISRNPINRRIALFFDDFLYGRKHNISQKNFKKILGTSRAKK